MKRLAPLAALALTACATAVTPTAEPQSSGDKVVQNQGGALLVAEAKAALARQDAEAATRLAELAVMAEPQTSAARLTLARSYVAAGRFDAAVAAWTDALAVAPEDQSAQLGRALALLATGRTADAVTMLSQLAPGDDVGLGFALAGDARGIAMLKAAAQTPAATGRTRQNLALAHAIAGEWTEARAVASRDVPAEALGGRLASWSKIATAAPAKRVAILLGVEPVPVDFGRPPALAPRVAPPPVKQTKAMTVAFAQPVATRSTGWVVQLGAYPDAKEREAAWTAMRASPLVKERAPLLDAKRQWQRLSLGGFVGKLEAQRLCVRLKQAGTDCFVRLDAPSA